MDRIVVRWQAFALVCVVLLALFGWAFWRNRQDMQAVNNQQAALQRTLTRLQNDQVALSSELEQVGTSSYIENRAREDYSFLKPGELRFEIVNPECLEGYTEAEMKILMQEIQVNVY